MKNYLLMKSKKIPTYLKYYLSKTRLNGLVFNKTYLENLSGTSFYLDHSVEDKMKINFKASESTQNSEPTPESPQDIHVVKGDNEVVIENKNLFIIGTKNDYTGQGTANFTITDNKLRNYIASGSANYMINNKKFKSNNCYISADYDKGETRFLIRAYDENNNQITSSVTGWSYNNYYKAYYRDSSGQFNLQSASYIQVGVAWKGTTGEYAEYSNIILTTSSNTSYVEHKEQNYPLTLDNIEMCNINNYADEIFKNVPECVYYDDTLEVGKWYKYGRIGKVVLDGSENWNLSSGNGCWITIQDVAYNSVLLSDYFIFKGVGVFNNTTGISSYTNQHRIIVCYNGGTSTNDLITFLSTHNVTVYYILSTPEKTLLSDTLQDELDNIYNNAHTYDQITNINQVNEDRPFVLDISYYRKVK